MAKGFRNMAKGICETTHTKYKITQSTCDLGNGICKM